MDTQDSPSGIKGQQEWAHVSQSGFSVVLPCLWQPDNTKQEKLVLLFPWVSTISLSCSCFYSECRETHFGRKPGFSSFVSFKASVNRIFICHIFSFSTLVLHPETQYFTPSPDLISKQWGKAADSSRMAPTPHSLHTHRSIHFSIKQGIWRLEI